MSLIDKAALRRPRLKHEDVEVPELGGTVRLRELTTGEVEQARGAKEIDEFARAAQLLGNSIIDEQGARLLADDEVMEVMRGLPVSVVERLMKTLNCLNGTAAEVAAKN